MRSVNLTLSCNSYTWLSASCFPYESLHTSCTWWPATDIRVLLSWEGWFLSVLISVSVDRCWAWRMARPLGTDRKQRGPKGRDPVSTRVPWRIKTNRYVFCHVYVGSWEHGDCWARARCSTCLSMRRCACEGCSFDIESCVPKNTKKEKKKRLPFRSISVDMLTWKKSTQDTTATETGAWKMLGCHGNN